MSDDLDLVVEETHVRTLIALAKYPAGTRALHLAESEFVHPTTELVGSWLKDLQNLRLAELLGEDRWRITHNGLRFLEAVDR